MTVWRQRMCGWLLLLLLVLVLTVAGCLLDDTECVALLLHGVELLERDECVSGVRSVRGVRL